MLRDTRGYVERNLKKKSRENDEWSHLAQQREKCVSWCNTLNLCVLTPVPQVLYILS